MSVPPNDAVTPPPAPAGTPSAEEKQWALFAHLSAILAWLVLVVIAAIKASEGVAYRYPVSIRLIK